MIKLKVTPQANFVEGRTQSYSITLEIIESTRSDLELFMVYFKNGREFFSHIASPVDMIEYPNTPSSEGEGYYRTKKVTLVLHCKADADEVVRLAKIDLDEFDRSIKNAETDGPAETFVINS